MQSRAKWVIGLGALALLGCGGTPLPRSQASPLINGTLPGFESTTLNGNPLDTSAFYGQRLIVSFVASDCAGCARTLQAAQGTYSDLHDVVVVGVFSREQTSEAARMISKHGVKFPVVVDAEGEISERFQIEELPKTFVADSQGRVHWVGGAELTEDTLTAAAKSVD